MAGMREDLNRRDITHTFFRIKRKNLFLAYFFLTQFLKYILSAFLSLKNRKGISLLSH